MSYLLDTNHASYLMAFPSLPLQKRMDVAFTLCTPVLGELWHAVHSSKRRIDNESRLRNLLGIVDGVVYDEEFAEEYGQIRAELSDLGRRIPQIDVQIAAIARVKNLTVLTADKHFGFVPRLPTENWLA